ncbi:MAG: hypothetical protein GYA55_06700, partial [SAR324 cluster bacterium]|nr:hypothetical protein [SAR324 cluster bacterium]
MPKINVQIGSQITTGSEIVGNKMPGGHFYSQEALDLRRALLKIDGFLAKIESGTTINLSEVQRRELIEALSKVRNEHKGHLVLSKTHWLHDKHIRNAIDEAIETLKSGLSFEALRDYHGAPERRTDTIVKLYQVLFNEHRSDTQDLKLKSNRGQAKPSEMIGAMKVLDDLLDEIEHNPSYKPSSAEKNSIEKALGVIEKYYDHPYRRYRPDSWKDARTRARINEARKALMSDKAFSGLRGPLNDDAELRTQKILDVYTRLFNDNKDLLGKLKAPKTRGSVDKRAEVYDIFCRIGNFITKIESNNEVIPSGRTRSQLINALETARKHYETNRSVRQSIDNLLKDIKDGRSFDAFRGPQVDAGEKRSRRLVNLHSFLFRDCSQGSWPTSMIKNRGLANLNLDRIRVLKELDALISDLKKFDNSPRVDENLCYLPKQDRINSLKATINTLRRHYDGHLGTHERQGIKGKIFLPEKSDRVLDAKYRHLIDQALKTLESKDGFAIQRGPTISKAEHNTQRLVRLFKD